MLRTLPLLLVLLLVVSACVPPATLGMPTPWPTATPPPHRALALQRIAERERLPLEELVVTFEQERRFYLLDRTYMTYTIFHPGSQRSFYLLVNMADNSIEDDPAAVERAEAEVERARYGKLEPALYERLQQADATDVVRAALWIGGQPSRSDHELFTALAARHPEAAAALAAHKLPFDIPDKALARQMRDEYQQMRREDITQRVAPILEHLQARGVDAHGFSLLPSVVITAPKALLIEIIEREDVTAASLDER